MKTPTTIHPDFSETAKFLNALSGRENEIFVFQTLPIDAVPDITNTQVQINTLVEGLAPEEIERTITFPIESAMGGITGVSQVRSITRFGLSQGLARRSVEIRRLSGGFVSRNFLV